MQTKRQTDRESCRKTHRHTQASHDCSGPTSGQKCSYKKNQHRKSKMEGQIRVALEQMMKPTLIPESGGLFLSRDAWSPRVPLMLGPPKGGNMQEDSLPTCEGTFTTIAWSGRDPRVQSFLRRRSSQSPPHAPPAGPVPFRLCWLWS